MCASVVFLTSLPFSSQFSLSSSQFHSLYSIPSPPHSNLSFSSPNHRRPPTSMIPHLAMVGPTQRPPSPSNSLLSTTNNITILHFHLLLLLLLLLQLTTPPTPKFTTSSAQSTTNHHHDHLSLLLSLLLIFLLLSLFPITLSPLSRFSLYILLY